MSDSIPSTSSSSSLRPLTLAEGSSLPTSEALASLRHQLHQCQAQLEHYDKLLVKLETITDEPVWDAFIPLGPLAYFPGKLVHTNDITELVAPPSPPAKGEEASTSTEPTAVLRSAKQAKASALVKKQGLEKEIASLQSDVSAQQAELSRQHAARVAGGRGENWTFNERGEVINDEGLPVFDIREELPAEEPSAVPTLSVKGKEKETAKPKMRYLIKKGGKQIVRPLNVPALTTNSPNVPPSKSSPNGVSTSPSKAVGPDQPQATKLDTKSILDALEAEKLADAETNPHFSSSESDASPPRESCPTPSSTTTPPVPKSPPSIAAASSPAKSKDFLSGFSSGFLRPKAAKASTPAAVAVTSPATSSTSKSTLSFPVPHEPLHHSLSPTKSIYRPTPPPSVPGTPGGSSTPRAGSPVLGHSRKVAFDLPQGEDPPERETKVRNPAIILPPPSSGDEWKGKQEGEKKPFVRPIKEKVVERDIKPPSLPRVGGTGLKKDRKEEAEKEAEKEAGPVKTMARPPKTVDPTPSAQPIHTISLAAAKIKSHEPGTATIPEILEHDEDEEEVESRPSLTSDASDSSSSGFYGSDDDDNDGDDEEFDIDTALHQREIALAYHERRQGLGAGAGTGPLGGDRDPISYDAWEQEEVPVEATLQGRQSGMESASRFRNGRLEATRMIIPDLLQKQVREEGQNSEEEEDGMTAEERERVRVALEKLARGESLEGFEETQREVGSEKKGREALKGVVERTPPAVKAVAPPKPTPSAPALKSPVMAPHAPVEKPKKLSRFKARQLGLEPDD